LIGYGLRLSYVFYVRCCIVIFSWVNSAYFLLFKGANSQNCKHWLCVWGYASHVWFWVTSSLSNLPSE